MSKGSTNGQAHAWPLVHHGGAVVQREQAVLPVGSIALRYGVSVFEGIRLYTQDAGGTAPWLLPEHVDRLRNSCLLMGLDDGCCDTVPGIIDEVVTANGVDADAYVRVAVSAGNSGGIDAAADAVLTVSVAPAGRKRWLAEGAGVRLAVSDRQRPSEAVFPNAAKNISAYAGPRLALAEAKRAGFDSCVLRTAGGLVSEAPTATLFLVENRERGAVVVTPRIEDNVLPGVTRAWVLAAARELGLVAVAEPVTPQRLADADEVFLCGTGLEFAPVREVAGRPVPGWPSVPTTTALVDAFFDQVRGRASAPFVSWTSAP